MSSKRPAALGLAGLLWSSATALAQSAPPLGASATFAVLGGATVRNSGSSIVTGNLGVSPGSTITGSPVVRLGDVRNDLAAGAQSDAATAYADLGTATCSSTLGATTLSPGVYCLSPTLGGTLTLDGGGNDNAVWIFRADSLTTAATSAIRLTNGAHASNVFWRVAGTATLGANTSFAGTLLAQGDVTLGSGTSVSGRVIALGRASAVALDASRVSLCCPQITVSNPGVATATVNAPFNQSFGQQGADQPHFTTSGTLPDDFNLSDGGTLSGTPTKPGSFPLEVRVTDGAGCTATSAVYTLTVGCQSIVVTNPETAVGVVGAQFSQKFGQSGAVGTATFSETGSLPTGLMFHDNGTLDGAPMEHGCFTIDVTVTDSNRCTGTTTYVLCIGCQPITVSCPANTNGTPGVPFSESFTEAGAMGTATFTTTDPLPTGLALATNGVLSGTTNQHGCFTITVQVTDSNGCSGTVTCTFCMNCQPIAVINPAGSSGTEGVFFSQPFTATGILGTPATFTTNDTLPAGMSLASNGVLSGVPTETGVFIIHVTATDTNGCSATGPAYTLTIIPPIPPSPCPDPAITPSILPPTVASVPYSQVLTATGGIPPYTFTVTQGPLPAGLSLIPTGPTTASIIGIPAVSGQMNVIITATDANGCTGSTIPTSIPALSGWALAALAALFAAAGFIALRNGGI